MLYNLQYRDTSTVTKTEVTGIDALFLDVSDLDQGEQYEFRVQEDDGGTVSDYSDWFGFSTQAGITYNLQYRDLSTLTTTTVTGIDAIFYDLAGLDQGEQYEFRVQEDESGTTSDYSDWFKFQTTGQYRCKLQITGSFSDNQRIDGSFYRTESIKGSFCRRISI